MSTDDIIALEERHQIPTYKKYPFSLERGEGCYVWDADGNKYLDFYGGHCVALLGHSPKRVVAAIQEQAATMLFYSNVCYSSIRARAATLLASMAPESMSQAFFCNSGSEANETALKLARLFTGRNGIIAMEGGFHGRTLGSLSATWNPKYRDPYAAILPETLHVPFGDLAAVARAIEEAPTAYAAVILEPIQSMAGIIEAPTEYYVGLSELCERTGTLLVFDEIQTGVGRTGTFSISEHYGIQPDLITLAKSLGSGIPVGAVLVSDIIAQTVSYGDHGTTFGGGMVPMAAVHAVLTTLQEDDLMPRAPAIFNQLSDGVRPVVKAVRGRGCLIGLELDGPSRPVINGLREKGIIAGTAVPDNVIRLMPPITTSDHDIDFFVSTLTEVIKSQTVEARV